MYGSVFSQPLFVAGVPGLRVRRARRPLRVGPGRGVGGAASAAPRPCRPAPPPPHPAHLLDPAERGWQR